MDSTKYQSDIIHDIEILCAFCSHRRDISLYMISRHSITLKVLEHSENVNIRSRMTRELARHDFGI